MQSVDNEEDEDNIIDDGMHGKACRNLPEKKLLKILVKKHDEYEDGCRIDEWNRRTLRK